MSLSLTKTGSDLRHLGPRKPDMGLWDKMPSVCKKSKNVRKELNRRHTDDGEAPASIIEETH
jgi:hypothetical protein